MIRCLVLVSKPTNISFTQPAEKAAEEKFEAHHGINPGVKFYITPLNSEGLAVTLTQTVSARR